TVAPATTLDPSVTLEPSRRAHPGESAARRQRDGSETATTGDRRQETSERRSAMRSVIASPFTSQDGFMVGPDGDIEWNVPYFDDEMATFVDQQLDETGALLYGRVTYQFFAQYWPSTGLQDDPRHAAKLNALPKLVFSKTLERADWNNSRLIRDDVPEEIA